MLMILLNVLLLKMMSPRYPSLFPHLFLLPWRQFHMKYIDILKHIRLLNQRSIMSGRGKRGKAKGKSITRSVRAGLQFPVRRVHCLLMQGNYPGSGAGIYLAAIMD